MREGTAAYPGSEFSFLNLLELFVSFVKRQDIQRIVEEVDDSFK
jgi:hypothetical protein